MALCTLCKRIPLNFFGPLPPNFFSPSDRFFHHRHHSPSALRHSATKGCPMCKILASQLQDQWLPQEIKDHERLVLKRGIIDSQQSFSLWIGADDISHNFFYHVPPSYQEALPEARIDELDDEVLLMRHWVNDCIENHRQCRENYPAVCPTRLLDLDQDQYGNTGDIVLVELDKTPEKRIPYATLSHCWGISRSRGPLTTVTANLASRKERIRFDELPLTFQDAVKTTRKLQIRYLWIDSLCIIQDSKDEWEKEAARMGEIYAGSVCTLCALASKDSHGGFFRATERKVEFDFRFDLSIGSKRIRIFAAEPNDWGLRGPVMERAWTLQERELSNRILHFSRHGLFWECKTLRATEDVPWLEYKGYDTEPPPKLIYNSDEEASGQYQTLFSLRRQWSKTVEDYAARKLTYGKDKLIALSGLAHTYRKNHQRGEYAAGLWEADMPSALLWETIQLPLPERPEEYRAPSWSWASVDGIISYRSQMLKSEPQHGGIWLSETGASPRQDPLEYDFGAFRVESMSVTPANHLDTMGAVSTGYIMLNGLVVTAIIDEEPSSDRKYDWLRDKKGYVVGALLADVRDEVHPGEDVFCISIRNEVDGALETIPKELVEMKYRQDEDHVGGDEMVMGLGLARIRTGAEDGEVYRRLGVVRWVKKVLYADTEVSTLKVV